MTELEVLINARKKAEDAVKDMENGDLKTKAFEAILTHLLSNEKSTPSEVKTKSHLPRHPAPVESPPAQKSFTSLSSTELDSLKQDIQKREKLSSRDGAILIAGYLEKKGQATFKRPDIEINYRALVRGGATNIPIVTDFRTLMSDLVREKFWFERTGRGEFRLSDAGVRKLSEMK